MAATNSEVWQRAVVLVATAVADQIQRIEIETSLPAKADPGSHIDVMVVADGQREKRLLLDRRGQPRRPVPDNQRVSRPGVPRRIDFHAQTSDPATPSRSPSRCRTSRCGSARRRYVLLAGGIGITAIANMASALRSLKADYRLVYAGRSRTAMAYLDELVLLHGDRLVVHVDDEGSLTAGARPDRDRPATDTELYMCGPIRLMDAVRRSWTAAGRVRRTCGTKHSATADGSTRRSSSWRFRG